MFNSIKVNISIVSFLSIFLLVSCLTDEEKAERTYEMEMAEVSELLAHLEAEGYDIDTTDLGVYYIVDEEGTGPNPMEGDTVSVEYTGAFLDGNIFVSSHNHTIDGKWSFVYLEEKLITGFIDALSVMNKGAEIDAIVPSSLGYGPQGTGAIPPYTSLIFSIKLHDLKQKSGD